MNTLGRRSGALLALALAAAICVISACDSGTEAESIQTEESAQVQQSAEQQAEQGSTTARPAAPQRGARPVSARGGDSDTEAGSVRSAVEVESRSVAEPGFVVQLLHAADMDGGVGALDNVETFSALLDGFRRQMPKRTLVLSSGDNFIPGPRYYAAGEQSLAEILGVPGNGRGDIALLNEMGFQASALGNHEFDLGPSALASTIAMEETEDGWYEGARFPYLSANLGLADDEHLRGLVAADGLAAPLPRGSLARSVIISVDGELVGILGATTPHLAWIAGVGNVAVEPADGFDLDALAEVIQDAVDDLTAQGVDKIILLAHMQQIEIEQQLASRLRDVDIIVAGGSNTILADKTDRLRSGDWAAGTYPLRMRSASGEPLLLVNTDADYRYIGRLVVRFDQRGLVMLGSIDPSVSGVYATDKAGRPATAGEPIPGVSRIVRSLREVIEDRDREIVGRTSFYLAGRRGDVRTQETNLGNLVADSFLWLARQFDPGVAVALKNSGGIRDQIGRAWQPAGAIRTDEVVFAPPAANPASGRRAGDISRFAVESVLRFNNGLVIVPLTAQQLVALLEHGVGFDGVGEVPDGRFPQIAGMRFSFDPAEPPGRRIRSLAIIDQQGRVIDRVVERGILVGDAEREVRMAVLDFTANGGDGYPFPLPAEGRIDLAGETGQYNPPSPEFPDTNGNGLIDDAVAVDPGLFDFAAPGTEQDALAEYLAQFYQDVPFDRAETSPVEDRRIQNLSVAGARDTVFALDQAR
ncbi:MAG: bifunctional metallophosphatase/5'-nucleotidase [Chloroflexi bacterium]|nr:bifunctional metallophosphatase/5'-nucleotidase [Chloroflexota bacterium]